MDATYMILLLAIGGISWFVSNRLKTKFQHYSKSRIGLTGREVAEKMLRDNGIYDVQVQSVQGALTDHYNPLTKTVNLSEWVYNQPTVAAAAVAAHECGHAVQHAHSYAWLSMRSAIVPVVSISSRLMTFVLIAGIAMLAFSGNPIVLIVGIAMFGLTTLFSFITLPVEFDASNRALAWLDSTNTLSQVDHDGAKDALKWAAMTYVVAALGSLAQLIYWIGVLNNRR
ncbi:MAG: zinc metallopeptidase [Bacteroidetes bacterium]|nr:zinc metallopeptidase [Bacteroidota bacterium]